MSLPTSRIAHPSEAPPIRWGILAPGWIATAFVDALRRHTRQEVRAVGSRSAEHAAQFAAEFDVPRHYGSYEELVADDGVDVIYVASPHSHHEEHSLLAIAAGKHVLVEKAFTPTAAAAQRVVDAAAAADVTLMEAMWTRFLPHIDVLGQLLSDGALGELETVVADHGQRFPYDPEFRLFNPVLAGGAMLDLGVYPTSLASFVLGTPGRSTAIGSRADTGVDRQISMLLDSYQAHPFANALVTTTLASKTPTTATVSGSLARVEIPGDFYAPQPISLITGDGEHLTSPEPEIKGHEGLAYEAAHFARLVSDGLRESPLLPLAETVSILATMEMAMNAIP